MNQPLDVQAARATWVADVKVQLAALNKLLSNVPPGVDVEVTASKADRRAGAISNPYERVETWEVSVSATKTERLI